MSAKGGTRRQPPRTKEVSRGNGGGSSGTSSHSAIGIDDADLHLRPADEDPVDTDDEDGPIGHDDDQDEAEMEDDRPSTPPAARELRGKSFKDEGVTWMVFNVGYDAEYNVIAAYYFNMDEVSRDDATLADCEWSEWTEIAELIDGPAADGGDGETPKKKLRKKTAQQQKASDVGAALVREMQRKKRPWESVGSTRLTMATLPPGRLVGTHVPGDWDMIEKSRKGGESGGGGKKQRKVHRCRYPECPLRTQRKRPADKKKPRSSISGVLMKTEATETRTFCMTCGYSFCVTCFNLYHGIEMPPYN